MFIKCWNQMAFVMAGFGGCQLEPLQHFLYMHALQQISSFIHIQQLLHHSLQLKRGSPLLYHIKWALLAYHIQILAEQIILKELNKKSKKFLSIVPDPHVNNLQGKQATADAVKMQLENCSWLHLACHGKQDLLTPTKSHLLLYNGTLELETILQMPLNNAEVVFLAACQTAMGDSVLVNESFHLSAGFIAAGFRGAIGTIWAMNDQDGPLVAEVFYSNLFQDSQTPQAVDAAEALHLAVKELRKQNVPYERWIPFIHMGI
ncbi:putative 30S ribosomal protein S17P-like [Mycena venus]|uniref:Putative 30S ribosomal protein S17P-like n=1 Tax=Mycena venus TaxID=2733690 RepID=A0A8H7CCL7_9AGAR|nr:putative 30S ribosomal protein S17P-like [Mycena venus]